MHQINGLMTIINHTIPQKSEEQNQLIKMVTTATDRLSQMVTGLLDINAIESGNVTMVLEKVELSAILRELEKEFSETAKKKQINLSATKPVLCFANVDKSRIYQVFENLVSNAIKFSPKSGNVSLSLETENGKVCFSVRDSGPGLSDEDKSKLFNKFQKLSAQPTDGEHSTGLGLSIVKRFSEAMNGEVWCESEWGNGATFFVEFESLEDEIDQLDIKHPTP
ncbi:MAG: two-component system sensor histidine kinase/response regulator [Arenicella sp.]